MKNFEIENKFEEKLRNVNFKYLIDCLFKNNYSVDELYNELNLIKENISFEDLNFIKDNYTIINKPENIDNNNNDILKDLTNDQILNRAKMLIDKYGKLDMIYIRVSTKNEGQQETDQLPDIINTFNLDAKKCLIIAAKESAFQIKKDKFRKFNIFYELIEKYKEYDKALYVWDLDRIYRNQKKQAYFISYFADKNKCIVLSYRQKFFHQFKTLDGMGRAMYNFMIEVFGWMAEEESKKKGDRLKKSLTFTDGRFYTNKGNLYGRKLLKKIINKGSENEKRVYFTIQEIDAIDSIIIKLSKKSISFRDIQKKFKERKNIKLSLGYLSKVVNKK